jgi:hypothetical protein
MPAISVDERPSIQSIVNETLETMPPIDLLPVTGVTAQVAYDLTTLYPWLTESSQIISIFHQPTGALRPVESGASWDWRYDADAPRLDLPGAPFSTGTTFYVKAHRPAHSWIRTGGVWGADTDGLGADTDEALPLVPLVKAATLAECYRRLGAGQGPDAYRDFYREREAHWTKMAALLRWFDDQESVEQRRPTFRMLYTSQPVGLPQGYAS